MDERRASWERAFPERREGGLTAAAARVATLLGELHWGGLGNASIGRGWLERARRLLDEAGPCVEDGYWSWRGSRATVRIRSRSSAARGGPWRSRPGSATSV